MRFFFFFAFFVHVDGDRCGALCSTICGCVFSVLYSILFPYAKFKNELRLLFHVCHPILFHFHSALFSLSLSHFILFVFIFHCFFSSSFFLSPFLTSSALEQKVWELIDANHLDFDVLRFLCAYTLYSAVDIYTYSNGNSHNRGKSNRKKQHCEKIVQKRRCSIANELKFINKFMDIHLTIRQWHMNGMLSVMLSVLCVRALPVFSAFFLSAGYAVAW